jgi:hypothetical protein
MSAEISTAAVVEINPRQEAQAAQRLEKVVKDFMGGLPYDRARVIERGQDGFEEGVRGFFKGGLALLILQLHESNSIGQILTDNFPGISRASAYGYMKVARAMAEYPAFKAFTCERGGYTKGLTLLESCTEEQVAGFDETGEVLGFTQDQIDKMSVLSLKKALRRAREKEAQAVRQAIEKTRLENDELRGQVRDLEAQVAAGETPADAALKRIQGASGKIFDGIRLLGQVEEALLYADKVVRQQFVGVCEHAISILEGLSTDASHAGAVEGADF